MQRQLNLVPKNSMSMTAVMTMAMLRNTWQPDEKRSAEAHNSQPPKS